MYIHILHPCASASLVSLHFPSMANACLFVTLATQRDPIPRNRRIVFNESARVCMSVRSCIGLVGAWPRLPACLCMYTYVHVHAYVCVHVIHKSMTYVILHATRTYIYSIRSYHFMPSYACVFVCTSACVRVCTRTHAHADTRMCNSAYMHTQFYVYAKV